MKKTEEVFSLDGFLGNYDITALKPLMLDCDIKSIDQLKEMTDCEILALTGSDYKLFKKFSKSFPELGDRKARILRKTCVEFFKTVRRL